MLLELTQTNKKLTSDIREFEQKNKDLSQRLQEVEEELSNKVSEITDYEDKIDSLQQELEARDKQLEDLTEKNKKISLDQQNLTRMILEEKAKQVEIMNEMNAIHERSTLMVGSGDNSMSLSLNMSRQPGITEYAGVIKPEYFNYVNEDDMNTLPTQVKTKMIAN